MAEQHSKDDDARARVFSKIVSESLISPSQEELLRQISGWPASESQKESPSRLMSSSQQTTPTSSRISAQDEFTVGCRSTTICTPSGTQNSDEKNEEEEQPLANVNDDEDSYEPNFESDRDCSLSTQPQNFQIAKNFALGGLLLNEHSPSAVKLKIPKPEPSSVSSKKVNPKSKSKKKINPKPAACRRIVVKVEEKIQMETIRSVNNLPDIVEESPVEFPEPATQLGAATRIACFDHLRIPNFGSIDTQPAANLNSQSSNGKTDTEMPFSHNLGEEQEHTSEGEETRASRVLPTYFTADTLRKNAPTNLEKDTQMGQENDTQMERENDRHCVPKRQRKEAKPFPNTFMDVVMHFPGGRPVGSENADIVEAAIKAGYTFPLPLSRRRYQV